MERKLFTALQGESAEKLNDGLSKQGFRRSQNVLYRPSCADCTACLSARIKVADFKPSKSQKRVMSRNKDMRRRVTSPWATEEQFSLFRAYLDTRHADGGMADMDIFEFAAMVEETPVRSRVIEYTRDEVLTAVCLTDLLDDGLSMVYSFLRLMRRQARPGCTSSLIISRSRGKQACHMSTLGIGCLDRPRWITRRSSRALRSTVVARGKP